MRLGVNIGFYLHNNGHPFLASNPWKGSQTRTTANASLNRSDYGGMTGKKNPRLYQASGEGGFCDPVSPHRAGLRPTRRQYHGFL